MAEYIGAVISVLMILLVVVGMYRRFFQRETIITSSGENKQIRRAKEARTIRRIIVVVVVAVALWNIGDYIDMGSWYNRIAVGVAIVLLSELADGMIKSLIRGDERR
jgi:hypothetical protein